MQSDQSDWTSGGQQSGSGSTGGLKREADATRTALNDATSAVRDRASGLASDAKQVASERAQAAQQTLGGYLENFVGALNAAGDHLKQSDQSQFAGLVDSAAGSVDNLARAVKEKPLGQVVDQLRTFGRSNPTVLLAGSVLAGLAAARFLKSSTPGTSSPAYPSGSSYSGGSRDDDYASGSSTGSSLGSSSYGSGGSSEFGSRSGSSSGGSGAGSSNFGSSPGGSSSTGSSSLGSSSSSTGSSFPSALSDAAGDRDARSTVDSTPYTPSTQSASSLPPLEGTPEVWPADYVPAGDRRND